MYMYRKNNGSICASGRQILPYLNRWRYNACLLCLTLVITLSCGSRKTAHNEQDSLSVRSDLQTGTGRPNILWIIADDLGPDLGCYGNPLVHTPHIDKLASEGTLFNHSCTVAAVCSVSRSALITGMYPVSIDCHQHRTQFKDSLPKPVRPVTEYFREAGYFVTNRGKTDYNFIHDKGSLYDGKDWRQRKPGQPFFAQIQIHYPHRPFKRDPEYPVDAKQVLLPPYYPDHPVARQDWALYLESVQEVDREVGKILGKLEDEGLSGNTVVFFFSDQGRPHVRCKQFLYDGGIRTPLIIRWPGQLEPGTVNPRLVSHVDLAPTAMKIAGIALPEYMQGRDFLGNGSVPRDHIYAMRDRRDETVDRIRAVRTKDFKYIRNFYPDRPYTQFNAYKKYAYPMLTLMQVMYRENKLTAEQARFMAEYRPAEELYDLKNDPYELHNLAGKEAYREEKEKLAEVLDAWLSEADLGQYPEDPREIIYAKKLMEKVFDKQMKAKGLSPGISDEAFLKYWEGYLTPTKKQVP